MSLSGHSIHSTDTVTTVTAIIVNPIAIAAVPSGSLAYVLTSTQLWQMPAGGGTPSLVGLGCMGGAALAVHSVTGWIYIASGNYISTCTPLGVAGSLAGNGTSGNMDGASPTATFSSPRGIVMDPDNQYLYVISGNTIRQVVVSTGFTTTLAGSGTAAHIDGTGLGASFSYPSYVEMVFS